MSTEIKVPTLGESVSEATIAKWLKQAGEAVKADEPIVELETDKVNLEVPAPVAGVLSEIIAEAGSDVEVGTVIGKIDAGGEAGAGASEQKKEPEKAPPEGAEARAAEKEDVKPQENGGQAPAAAEAKRSDEQAPTERASGEAKPGNGSDADAGGAARGGNGARQAGPAARKLASEHGLDLADVPPSGPKGNVTKSDVASAAERGPSREARAAAPPAKPAAGAREDRVRMTRLRKRIAERLKVAQNEAAMLTTFNEVDMGTVMGLRARHQDAFTKKHGVKLGFMSFFVKASIEALKAYPAANAEIDGDDIVYKRYFDIGVAVSTEQGLLVPVLRDADGMSLAAIERRIGDLGKRAREGKLSMEELQGGTFSITNGGIFGSLMSTPILNPPQVAILGMHKIQQRPMVMPGGAIEARPMMYVALSYDHRIIDGREAVSFLVRVKECVEDPERILLDA